MLFYLINKTKCEYFYIELYSEDSLSINDIIKFSNWSYSDTLLLEHNNSLTNISTYNNITDKLQKNYHTYYKQKI
jgi:hypothetical protein